LFEFELAALASIIANCNSRSNHIGGNGGCAPVIKLASQSFFSSIKESALGVGVDEEEEEDAPVIQ
jgi:hypothetical protein